MTDTGGDNYINAPFSVTDEYYRHVEDLRWGSLGGFNCTIIIPCSTKLRDLVMHIGNGTATIRAENMMGRPLSAPVNPSWTTGKQPHFYREIFIESHGGVNALCVPTLQPFGPSEYGSCLGIGLIGAPFFHEYYAVFNEPESSVSYAPYRRD